MPGHEKSRTPMCKIRMRRKVGQPEHDYPSRRIADFSDDVNGGFSWVID